MSEVILRSPISGRVELLSTVPDPVFAQKMMGDGLAIDPTEGLLVSPISGEVVQLHRAGHALTIKTFSGMEVLMHIGVNTVNLKGEGFTPLVKVGKKVNVGTPLIEFDLDKISRKVESMLVVLIITSGETVTAGTKQGIMVRALDGFCVVGAKDKLIQSEQSSIARQANSVEKLFKVLNPHGLHARPAAMLVNAIKELQVEIELHKDNRQANGRSLLQILSLEVNQGDEVLVKVIGEDHQKALDNLAQLFAEVPPSPQVEKSECSIVSKISAIESNVPVCAMAVSPGLSFGPMTILKSRDRAFKSSGQGVQLELQALERAMVECEKRLLEMVETLQGQGIDEAEIFAAQTQILKDPTIRPEIETLIHDGHGAAWATNEIFEKKARSLAEAKAQVISGRAADVRDVGQSLVTAILGEGESFAFNGGICVALDLLPSQAAQLKKAGVKGIITVNGGATSHMAILARSMGIPALVSAPESILDFPDGTIVIVNGRDGEFIVNPADEVFNAFKKKQQEENEIWQRHLEVVHQPTVTKDGAKIVVAANIGEPEDATSAQKWAAEGCGLVRTEFLFMNRTTAPTEEEEFASYKAIAEKFLVSEPVVFRTLDVGGDKPMPFLPLSKEENPFLGVRGLRLSFRYEDLFRQQLRALIRLASVHRQVHIMLPMVSDVSEFLRAKNILNEETVKLGGPVVPLGVMIEVPSAALVAEALAREADFFSIGTNDLSQYVLAMDRGNRELARHIDGLHPAVLRLIRQTVEAAHRHGKWVGVCGGLASQIEAIPVLLGLGVDELSVSISALPEVRAEVRRWAQKDCALLAKRALESVTVEEVRKQIKERTNEAVQRHI